MVLHLVSRLDAAFTEHGVPRPEKVSYTHRSGYDRNFAGPGNKVTIPD